MYWDLTYCKFSASIQERIKEIIDNPKDPKKIHKTLEIRKWNPRRKADALQAAGLQTAHHIKWMQFITLNCSCPDHICSVFDKVIYLQSSIMQQSQLRTSYKQRSYSAVKAIFSYIKAEWDGRSCAEPSAVGGAGGCACVCLVCRGARAGPAAHAHTCAPSPGACPGSWHDLQSASFNPALVGTAPSSVHSEDVFCSHRNRCTSEGERQKNEAEQKCAVWIDRSGCGALHKVAKGWRQWAAWFICGYVIKE